MAGEAEVEGGPEGVVAGVGGRGGGVESLRLPLLLLLLQLARVEAGSSELWPNSSSSSREILRQGASEPAVGGGCDCFRPTEEFRESVSVLPSWDGSLKEESKCTAVTTLAGEFGPWSVHEFDINSNPRFDFHGYAITTVFTNNRNKSQIRLKCFSQHTH